MSITPLSVRPTKMEQTTRVLRVYFYDFKSPHKGITAIVVDPLRGHAVRISTDEGQSLADFADGRWAFQYDYLNRGVSGSYGSGYGHTETRSRDRWTGTGWEHGAYMEDVFVLDYSDTFMQSLRCVVVEVPFKRYGDEYHWSARDAVKAAISKQQAARKGWYTIG